MLDATRRRPHLETRLLLTSAPVERVGGVSVPGFELVPLRDALRRPDALLVDPAVLAARLGGRPGPERAGERFELSRDGRRLTIDGTFEFQFRPGRGLDAIRKLHAAHRAGKRLPIGELTDNGSMRRLFGERWSELKRYVTSVDGLWGFRP
jgi:hypothetical protein